MILALFKSEKVKFDFNNSCTINYRSTFERTVPNIVYVHPLKGPSHKKNILGHIFLERGRIERQQKNEYILSVQGEGIILCQYLIFFTLSL